MMRIYETIVSLLRSSDCFFSHNMLLST